MSTLLCAASFVAYLGYVGIEYGVLMTSMALVQTGQAVGVFAVPDFLIPGSPGAIIEDDVSPGTQTRYIMCVELRVFTENLLWRVLHIRRFRFFKNSRPPPV